MASKTIPWGDGSNTNITITPDSGNWVGTQVVDISVSENFGDSRQKSVEFYSDKTPKVATVEVTQEGYTLALGSNSELTWESNETDTKYIVLRTNGTIIKDYSAALSGDNAEFVVSSPPVLTSSSGGINLYTISVTPKAINRTENAYAASVTISGGLNRFITLSPIKLLQKSNPIVSEKYTDFVLNFVFSSEQAQIPAGGAVVKILLAGVTCSLVQERADGSHEVTTGLPYEGWDTKVWYLNFSVGTPVRGSVTSMESTSKEVTSDGGPTWVVPFENLNTTEITYTDANYTIVAWPEGMTVNDSQSQSGTWTGGIENNTYTDTVGDPTIAFVGGAELRYGNYVIARTTTSVEVYVQATKVRAWTSGSSSTEYLECIGINNDTGVEDAVIINTSDNNDPGWITSTRSYPVALNNLHTTKITINLTENRYYTRTFKLKVKVKSS